jgi:hypothetical protein
MEGKSNDKAKEIYHKFLKSGDFALHFHLKKYSNLATNLQSRLFKHILFFKMAKWWRDVKRVNGIVYSTLESLEIIVRLYRNSTFNRWVLNLENQPISHVNTVNLMAS